MMKIKILLTIAISACITANFQVTSQARMAMITRLPIEHAQLKVSVHEQSMAQSD